MDKLLDALQAHARGALDRESLLALAGALIESGEADPDAVLAAAREQKRLGLFSTEDLMLLEHVVDSGLADGDPWLSDDEATQLLTPSEGQVTVGDVLNGRFELVAMLGQGGMGTVFRAIDRLRVEAQDRHHAVAIKVINEAVRRHPNAELAFEREVKKAQSLTHDNICRVHDLGRDGSVLYMSMEYLTGSSLDDLAKRPGFAGMPLNEALQIIAPVCEALGYAHGKNFVHHDLKPANIFRTDDGRIKVIDFGVARAVTQAEASEVEQTILSEAIIPALAPAYASPEMLLGEKPDKRDDIYALGCVTYALLTGRHPFDRLPATIARQRGLKPDRPPGLRNGQWSTLRQSLAFDRVQRTPNAQAFLEGLTREKSGRRRGPVIAATIATILAIGGLGFWMFHDRFTNHKPEAADDVATTSAGALVPIDVLANDRDSDSDTLTVREITTEPSHGATRVDATGRILYQPDAGFSGTDSFDYSVMDGRGGAATATVRVTVARPVPVEPGPAHVRDIVSAADCALLDPVIRGQEVYVSGHTGSDDLSATLVPKLKAIPGVAQVSWQVQQIGAAHCMPIDALKPLIQTNRDRQLGLTITTPTSVFHDGMPLLATVRAPAFDSFLYVDYFSLDGSVLHMLPGQDAPNSRRLVGAVLKFDSSGTWEVGPPYGTEMLTVIASAVPLFTGKSRPETENAFFYVEALKSALAPMSTRPQAKPAVAAVVFVRMAPKR